MYDAGKDIAWLTDLSEQRNPFQTITHCMCEVP